MEKRYYLDTSIWMDMYEDRKDFNGLPLGNFALKLFILIKTSKDKLIITDILIKELEMYYSIEEINGMVKLYDDVIEKITATKEQQDEARDLAANRDVPLGDVLHAVIARDNNLILITRDKHFRRLMDISDYYKPEEII